MAYTSIIPVHRLDNSINYIKDKEKTTKPAASAGSLEEAIDYALNRDKTETMVFEDAIGCTCEDAFSDMLATKRRFHKVDGVQGYHLIQSFAAGEVSPELAHLIGLELAEQLLKGKYEVVVTITIWCLIPSAWKMEGNTTATAGAIMRMCGGYPMDCAKNMACPLSSREAAKGRLMLNGRRSRTGNQPGGPPSVWILEKLWQRALAGGSLSA